MKKIFTCRRSSLALIGMMLLALIAFSKGHDVAMAISGIVLAVAGSNAYEKRGQGEP
jgi:hypothetical protein